MPLGILGHRHGRCRHVIGTGILAHGRRQASCDRYCGAVRRAPERTDKKLMATMPLDMQGYCGRRMRSRDRDRADVLERDCPRRSQREHRWALTYLWVFSSNKLLFLNSRSHPCRRLEPARHRDWYLRWSSVLFGTRRTKDMAIRHSHQRRTGCLTDTISFQHGRKPRLDLAPYRNLRR